MAFLLIDSVSQAKYPVGLSLSILKTPSPKDLRKSRPPGSITSRSSSTTSGATSPRTNVTPGPTGSRHCSRSRAESLVLPPAVQPPARHLGSRSGAARTERRAHGADDPPRVNLRPAAARAPSQFGADRRRRTGDPPAKLGQLHRPPRAVRQRDRRSALHREPAPHVPGPRLGRAYAAHRRLPRSHGLLRFEPPAQRGACALFRGRRQPHRHDPTRRTTTARTNVTGCRAKASSTGPTSSAACRLPATRESSCTKSAPGRPPHPENIVKTYNEVILGNKKK